MKKSLLGVGILIAAFALVGCGKTTKSVGINGGGSTPLSADQVQVNTVLTNNPTFVDEDVWQSSNFQDVTAGLGFAAVRPIRFRRVITNVDRQVSTVYGAPDSTGRPTLAVVTITRHLTGTFNLLAGSIDSTDTTKRLISKPLDDVSTRRILLMRKRAESRDQDSTEADSVRWRMVGTSFVNLNTTGGSTHIVSVRLQAGPLDTTITDPLEMHKLRRVVRCMPDTPIRLTVTTTRNDDVVLFYGRDSRRRFLNNGDNTYTFVTTSGRYSGLRHLGVDALSKGSIYDDTAAYDANAWILPMTEDSSMEHPERR